MPPRPKILRLPRDSVAHVRVIAERSAPDPNRPRLADEHERRLEDVERRSAACYAEAEELAHQMRILSANMMGDEVTDVGGMTARGGEIRGGR